MKLIIHLQDELPAEQLTQIPVRPWDLQVRGYVATEVRADKIEGGCAQLQFKPPVTTAQPTTPDPTYAALTPLLGKWFIKQCGPELKTIRKQTVALLKKVRLKPELPEMPLPVLAAIVVAAATQPGQKLEHVITAATPYLHSIVDELRRQTTKQQLLDWLER